LRDGTLRKSLYKEALSDLLLLLESPIDLEVRSKGLVVVFVMLEEIPKKIGILSLLLS
jgi:hypothetical protein